MMTVKNNYPGVPLSRFKKSSRKTPNCTRFQNVSGLAASQQTSKDQGLIFFSRWMLYKIC